MKKRGRPKCQNGTRKGLAYLVKLTINKRTDRSGGLVLEEFPCLRQGPRFLSGTDHPSPTTPSPLPYLFTDDLSIHLSSTTCQWSHLCRKISTWSRRLTGVLRGVDRPSQDTNDVPRVHRPSEGTRPFAGHPSHTVSDRDSL